MYFKKYQIKVVDTLKQFLQVAHETKTSFDVAKRFKKSETKVMLFDSC
ncbi:MAG: hypothetical protein K8R53_07580 [Bacteroidales bacterium]|nr:hypothetical protein [Bacteroidales bacterium]